MAEELQTLLVRLDADVERLRRGLDKATRKTDESTRRMERMVNRPNKAMLALGKTALSLVPAFTAGFAVAAINNFLQTADDMKSAADKIGLSTTALQELRFAGEEVNVTSNTTDMALQRFTRRIGEAAQGTGELKGILEQYNIAVRNSDGSTRNMTDVLADLADTVADAESDQERLRIAFKAFDSEGAALVNVLKDGSAGLEEMRKKVHALGLVVEQETVEEMADLNREIEVMLDMLKKGGIKTVGAFAAAMSELKMAITGTSKSPLIIRNELNEKIEELRDLNEKLFEAQNGPLPAALQSRSLEDQQSARLRAVQRFRKEIEETEDEISRLSDMLQDVNPPAKIKINTDDRLDKKALERAEKFNNVLQGVETRTQGVISSILELQGVSASEIEISITALQIENTLKREGIELNDQERAQLNQALDLLGQKIDKQEELSESARDAARASEEWTNALNQGLADAIFRAKSFGDILDALVKRLLNSALFGLDGKGGLLGGITNTLGTAIGSIFTPGFAGGGQTSVPSIVGERGRETIVGSGLFIPSGSAKVINAADTRSRGGGGVTVYQTVHFDTTVQPTVKAMIESALPSLTEAAARGAAVHLNRGI